ncbi:uncharacterized protein LOC129717730 [Wyeomyia smithii]|uniref:uncharacterized protein LOC129717730 n=1 Tax=Wyeomyia smithii TaxID=174621 RepID=UPI002467B09D|nr:uncharacterized protein LOC129717730 [Wyeomyia smithii]
MNNKITRIRNDYKTLQTQHTWAPISESKDQFSFKFPSSEQSAELINSTNRIDYITASHAYFRRDPLKPIKLVPRPCEKLVCHTPADTYKFGLNCSKHVERPVNVIHTNETGFARIVDPYLSTTGLVYVPQEHKLNDCITFWNWTTHDSNGTQVVKERESVPSVMISRSKKPLRMAFSSEIADKFLSPMVSNPINHNQLSIPTKMLTLVPTDRMESSSENRTYGSNINCARIFKQTK